MIGSDSSSPVSVFCLPPCLLFLFFGLSSSLFLFLFLFLPLFLFGDTPRFTSSASSVIGSDSSSPVSVFCLPPCLLFLFFGLSSSSSLFLFIFLPLFLPSCWSDSSSSSSVARLFRFFLRLLRFFFRVLELSSSESWSPFPILIFFRCDLSLSSSINALSMRTSDRASFVFSIVVAKGASVDPRSCCCPVAITVVGDNATAATATKKVVALKDGILMVCI
mmetsp:Transcript_3367/g.5985  ORF Transcript_3367/g.5985 Transcript_3367/m.5985 type:complete len:220 (+) Transcript_3367:1935-2594(+)